MIIFILLIAWTMFGGWVIYNSEEHFEELSAIQALIFLALCGPIGWFILIQAVINGYKN